MTTQEMGLLAAALTLAVGLSKTLEKAVTALVRKKWPGADRATANGVAVLQLDNETKEIFKSMLGMAQETHKVVTKEDAVGRPLVHGWHVAEKTDEQTDVLHDLMSTGARLREGVAEVTQQLGKHEERIVRALNDLGYSLKKN